MEKNERFGGQQRSKQLKNGVVFFEGTNLAEGTLRKKRITEL